MKAVLIINMPKDFDYRRCSIGGDGNIYYEREGEQRVSIIGNVKNLKLLPQKKETRNAIQYSGLAEEYRKEGWNDCLREIEK